VRTKNAEPAPANTVTNTDVCYFNGVGLNGWKLLQEQKSDNNPLHQLLRKSHLVGGFADTLLYLYNCVTAADLPERCKQAYRWGCT
jgi:hypothetical protein